MEPASTGASTPAAWPLWQRVGVRYLLLHWLLYAFPAPLDGLWRAVAGVWRKLLGDGASPPNWVTSTENTLDRWWQKPSLWEDSLTWLSERNLTFGLEMHHSATRIGDTAAGWTRVAYVVICALLLTGIWTLLDRRGRGHPRLARWLHLGARWWLGLIMLRYGVGKLYGGQFPPVSFACLSEPLGNLPPDGMLWSFMAQSDGYVLMSAIAEMLAFALLLHRRTALLGCFVAIGVTANVCALNWFYGVPLKQYSSHLLLASILLLLPYRHRLWAMFVSDSTTLPPLDLRVVHSRWLAWTLLAIGLLLGLGAASNAYLNQRRSHERWQQGRYATSRLQGLWSVQWMRIDGVDVGPDGWRDIAIDRGHQLRIRGHSHETERHSFTFSEDTDAGTITLRPTTLTADNPAMLTWQLRYTNTDLEPSAPANYEGITLRGEWQGKPFVANASKTRFAWHQPFWLTRDLSPR